MVASWVVATQNEIGAGFSVSLSLASGGDGPFETGATWTPTFNASPATNNVAVENCTIQDSLGNSASVNQANPLAAPISGHTYTFASPGSINVTVTETQISPPVTATSNGVGASALDRVFSGVDNNNTATSATASGNNAVLSDSTTISGQLFNVGVGTVFPTLSPANQYVVLILPHTSSPHTFTSSGFAFPVIRVVSGFSFTNQLGAVISSDIYYSSSLLNASFTLLVTS
jgi:hypothetical protein